MESKYMKLDFALDNIELLKQDSDCMMVRLALLHEGENRNQCDITHEAVVKSIPTIYNKPIVYRLNNKYFPLSSTDVLEHSREQDTTMMQAGSIPESAPMEFVERNGKVYLETIGIIHKIYNPTLVKILKNRNGTMKVSIEIKIPAGERNERGILKIDEFIFMSVCLLSEDTVEGIEGSNLIVTKFSNEDYNEKYMKFMKEENPLINTIKTNAINAASYIVEGSEANVNMDFARDYGTGAALKVDKSKDAMSDKAWGSVDKTSLRNRVLSASNYKSLVNDVYLVVEDGWEEAPSSKLKYPVMCIEGDKVVYNRGGLSSALGYAKAEDNSEATRKAEGLYKKLDLGEDKKNMSEELKNKLDKDNKDIEEIREDADAQEDDVKEKVKKNKIDPHDEGEEGLEDDVDSDKDYWRKKVNELEIEKNALEEKVRKYEREKEVDEMKHALQEYAHIFDEEEKCALEKEMAKCSKEEFELKLGRYALGFAAKMKDEEKMAKEEKMAREEKKEDFSYMGFSVGIPQPSFSASSIHSEDVEVNSFEDVCKKYLVK